MSAPMRHWVAASAGDLHRLALREAFPRAADGRVTGPMSPPVTRACGYPMVAQTLRTLANPAGLMPRSHRRWATSKAWTARAQSPPCPRPHLPNPVLSIVCTPSCAAGPASRWSHNCHRPDTTVTQGPRQRGPPVSPN
ncbi:hypothetical protein IB62_000055 [Xanthomonas euvesicatoria]|nr:hypothetical protein IB62_000055 [Xanthomonas euvesicatoria]